MRLECLRPDVGQEDEQVITSLCQFDMLAGFAAIAGTSRRSDPPYLAQFARWFAERTDPIVVEMIEGGPMRDTFLPQGDDELAAALRALANNASRMAGMIHGWHGYEDPRIEEFLIKHPEG